jgi:pyruvate dehydrogenase E2 component (dihydrolipoamide acetyltransferase)
VRRVGAGSGSEPEPEPATGWGGGIPLLDLAPLPDFSLHGPVEVEPLRSIRRKTARRMATASLLVAQVSHTDEANVTELDALRRRLVDSRAGQPGAKLTLLAFLVKAVVRGLKEWRMFNASLDPQKEQIIYKRYYHIGVAVDSGRGLIVPVIRDADRLSVVEIASEIDRLASAAREDRLVVAELRGASFTVSNIGNLGGFSPNPIVNYPEVALLGLGRARERPVVEAGQVVVRRVLPLALSFDHRVADGGEAARFMNALVRRLEDPLALLVEA